MPDLIADYINTKNENCEINSTMAEVKELLSNENQHYNEDNIAKRDGWMQGVNEKFADIYANSQSYITGSVP